MDKTTTNLKLLGAIKKHLDTLEDAFYDGIPNELLQNNHITEFTHIMELLSLLLTYERELLAFLFTYEKLIATSFS